METVYRGFENEKSSKKRRSIFVALCLSGCAVFAAAVIGGKRGR